LKVSSKERLQEKVRSKARERNMQWKRFSEFLRGPDVLPSKCGFGVMHLHDLVTASSLSALTDSQQRESQAKKTLVVIMADSFSNKEALSKPLT
jgi:hypothetical protein